MTRPIRTLLDAGKLRIAKAAIDPHTTCPAGPVWLPLGAVSGPVRLIDLAAVIPEPSQTVRKEEARQRRGHRR